MAAPETSRPFDPVESIEPHILHKLDPEFVAYYTKVMSKAPPPGPETIEEVRANPSKFMSACALDTTGYENTVDKMVTSEDGYKVPVRIYYPDKAKHGDGPYPVHVNYHGGGFVLGSLSSDSTICMSMSEGAGVAVVDVNYRHCPEAIWGKCFQDAWAALNWTRDNASTLNFKPDSISLGGISAGGHISIIMQHLARDADFPLKLCMPSVPPATYSFSYAFYTESPFASFHEFNRTLMLPWMRIKWFGDFVTQRHPTADPSKGGSEAELRRMWPEWWLEPMKATNWKALCPTFIRTAECDMLRDEGEAYAMKLVATGNKVTVKRYLGMPHAFMTVPSLTQKKAYDVDAIVALKDAHAH